MSKTQHFRELRPMDEELISRSEAARRLGVTEKTLYSWEKRGLTPSPERDARGWRRYSARQLEELRECHRRLHPHRQRDAERPGMGSHGDRGNQMSGQSSGSQEISARNRLRGTITSITGDGVLAEVVIDLGHGNEIVSVITRSSVERLELKVGESAVAVMKSTEVMVGR